MRVAAWNLRHGLPRHGLTARAIRERNAAELDAGILGVQEIDPRLIRSWFRDQPRMLAKAPGDEMADGPVNPIAGVRAVLVDAAGVLALPDRTRVADALAAVGARIDSARVPRAHYIAQAALDAAGGEAMGRQSYDTAFVAALGVAPNLRREGARAMAQLFTNPAAPIWSEPVPGASEAIARLRAAGIRVGVVTNSDGCAEHVMRRLGIAQTGPGRGAVVDAVFDSGVVGSAKPDRRIFDAALAGLGAPANSAIHIGDSLVADVQGALAAGITPLHLDPAGACHMPGHRHVRSLTEVADRILGPVGRSAIGA